MTRRKPDEPPSDPVFKPGWLKRQGDLARKDLERLPQWAKDEIKRQNP